LLSRVSVFHVVYLQLSGHKNSEEIQILEEINHEDPNAYLGGYLDIGRKYFGGRSGK
jgi:hypothetical protein